MTDEEMAAAVVAALIDNECAGCGVHFSTRGGEYFGSVFCRWCIKQFGCWYDLDNLADGPDD